MTMDDNDLISEATRLLNQPGINFTQLSVELGIGRTTLWRYRKGEFSKFKALAIIASLQPQTENPANDSRNRGNDHGYS